MADQRTPFPLTVPTEPPVIDLREPSVGSNDETVDRLMRVILRAHRPRPGIETFVAQMGILGAACFGAWWTVQAVADGRPVMMVVRFTLSVVLGLWYVLLLRAADPRR